MASREDKANPSTPSTIPRFRRTALPPDHQHTQTRKLRLKQEIPNPLNQRRIPPLLHYRIMRLPINLPSTAININLTQLQPSLALPEVSACPEEEHDGHGQV